MDGAMTQDVRVTNVYQGKHEQVVGARLMIIGLLIALAPLLFGITSAVLFFCGIAVFIGGGIYLKLGKVRHWYHAE